jgi:hypothetical protein
MKISPISNTIAAYAAFAGDGQHAGAQYLQSGADGSSHPVDTVWLSSAARAHLEGTGPVDSDLAGGPDGWQSQG